MHNVIQIQKSLDPDVVIDRVSKNTVVQEMYDWYDRNVVKKGFTKDENSPLYWEHQPYAAKKNFYGDKTLGNAFARMFVDRIRSTEVDIMCDVITVMVESGETELPRHVSQQVLDFKNRAKDKTYFTPVHGDTSGNRAAMRARWQISMNFIDAMFKWRV